MTGSKDPGHTAARRTARSSRARVTAGRRARPYQSVVSPYRALAVRREPRRPRPARRRGVARSTTTSAPARASRGRAGPRAPSRTLVVGHGVRRVEEHHVVRRRGGRGRATGRPAAAAPRRRAARACATLRGSARRPRGRARPAWPRAAPRDAPPARPRREPAYRSRKPQPGPASRAATRAAREQRLAGPVGRSGRVPSPAAAPAAGGRAGGRRAIDPRSPARHAFSRYSACSSARRARRDRGRSAGCCAQRRVGGDAAAAASSRASRDDVLVAAAPQSSRRLERRPDCEAPSTSPSRRCSRSSRESSKPSVVAATASSRSRAGVPARRVGDQQAQPGRARRGRPGRAAGAAGRRRTGRRP